jgi:hypothetical protein
MSLENVDFIKQLIVTNPPGGDQRSQGDDHLRLIKHVLKTTFPNMNGAMNAAPADLNLLTGMVAHPTMITPIPEQTFAPFYQAAAPTGWQIVTTLNDRVLRAVSGAGGGTGGTWTISGLSVNGHALTADELPQHTHTLLWGGQAKPGALAEAEGIGGAGSNSDRGGGSNVTNRKTLTLANTGGNQAHSHSIASTGAWRPAYANVIICQKMKV